MTTNPVHAHIPQWTFGDRLRKIRTTLDYTQDDFARLIGAGTSSLKQWETDRSRPRDIVATAKRIQLATGIPADWILGVNAESPPNPSGPGGLMWRATRDSNPQPSDPKVAILHRNSNTSTIEKVA